MLSVGPSSSCDVCFESFDTNLKAPTSITCGHVFCNQCVLQFRAAQNNTCPMCRTTYDFRYCAKLHIDADSLAAEQQKAGCPPEDLALAARLHRAISAIADEGISEQDLRQLIMDAKAFLHTQPRNLHKDLRIAYRMISFLCDTKSAFRTQTKEVHALKKEVKQLEECRAEIEKLRTENENLSQEVANLESEQTRLQKELDECQSTRTMERDTADAVEESLRRHIERIRADAAAARDAYLGLVRMSNRLSTQYEELRNQLSQRTVNAGQYSDTYKSSNFVYSNSSSDLVNPLLDRRALQGVAMQDPKTPYLISPLPELTTALSDVPLPELDEDNEEDDEEEEEDEEDGLSTPDSDHPNEREFRTQLPPSAEMAQPLRSALRPSYEPSGLSRTAPISDYQGRARSSSNPIEHVSRSHSPAESIVNSTPPTSPPEDANRTRQHQFSDHHLHPTYNYYQASRGQPIPYSRNQRTESVTSSTPSSSSSPSHRVQEEEQQHTSRFPSPSLTTTPQPNAYQSRSTAEQRAAPAQQDNVSSLARLQSILTDTHSSSYSTSSISASMPALNSGRHFPPSFSISKGIGSSSSSSSSSTAVREAAVQREQRPSPPLRTDSSASTSSYSKMPNQTTYTKAQSSTSDQFSHLLASHYQSSSSYTPMPSTSPNTQKMSTASAQAQKLEAERRARRIAEEEERAERHRAEQEPPPPQKLYSASSAAAAAASARKEQQQQYYSSSSSNNRSLQSNGLPASNSYSRSYDQGIFS